MNYYYELIQQAKRIAKFIKSLCILKDVYDQRYFEKIKQQIIKMKKEQTSGPIDSMFILMTKDEEHNFKNIKLLEKYLGLIFSHSSCNKGDKDHIKKELIGNQSLNTLFEINIIGNVLNQLPSNKAILYSKTYNKKNVDVEIDLVNRPIYIEISVLGESKGDKNIRERMSKNKIHVWSSNRDIERDTIRFSSKINYKLRQFFPHKPNVLILSTFDFFPAKFNIDIVMKNTCFLNAGLILQFDRKNIQKIHKDNLDPSCTLTKEEHDKLIELFQGKNYEPVYYGTF